MPAIAGGRPRDRDGADGERARGRMPRQPERHAGSDGKAAHSARPWLGRTRSTRRWRALRRSRPRSRRREVDGLTYREVVCVTTIHGGLAGNVVPDLFERTSTTATRPHRARRPRRRCARCCPVRRRGRRRRAARPRARRHPLVERLAARLARAPPEAGVDGRRGVRRERRGRRQLRPGRPGVRSPGRRAGRRRERCSAPTRCCARSCGRSRRRRTQGAVVHLHRGPGRRTYPFVEIDAEGARSWTGVEVIDLSSATRAR